MSRSNRPTAVIAGQSASKTRVNALVTRQSIVFARTSREEDGPPNSGLPEFGHLRCASRINPTCVVKPGGDMQGCNADRTSACLTSPNDEDGRLVGLTRSCRQILGPLAGKRYAI